MGELKALIEQSAWRACVSCAIGHSTGRPVLVVGVQSTRPTTNGLPHIKTKCRVTGPLKVPAAMQRLIYQGKVLKEEERDLASFGGAFARVCVEHHWLDGMNRHPCSFLRIDQAIAHAAHNHSRGGLLPPPLRPHQGHERRRRHHRGHRRGGRRYHAIHPLGSPHRHHRRSARSSAHGPLARACGDPARGDPGRPDLQPARGGGDGACWRLFV